MVLNKLCHYLKEETSAYSLAIFRILFGAILFAQSFYWICTNFIQENIIEPSFLFPFIKGLNPLSDSLMNYGLNGILIISSIGILTNRFFRAGLILYLFSFTYLWLLCQGFFNNHYYLFSIICFLLIFPKSLFSNTEKVRIPRIYLFSLQALIIIVYVIAGINKINPYWLIDFQPMKYILTQIGLAENSFLIPVFIYLGLCFDLLIGVLLVIKRTRYVGIIIAVLFHLINFFIFIFANGEIGFFPFIMIATLILFVDSNKLESLKLKENAKILSRQNYNKPISYFLLLFLFFQIILPFRHVLFNGYVDYNGIGQRFSWRLKNMYKENDSDIINFKLFVKDFDGAFSNFNLSDEPITVAKIKEEKVNIHLTERQKTNIFYYPNMIPLFAQKTKSLIQSKVKLDLIITGKCYMGFMGRDYQLLFDTTIDLTNAKIVPTETYKTNHWLNELKPNPWEFK